MSARGQERRKYRCAGAVLLRASVRDDGKLPEAAASGSLNAAGTTEGGELLRSVTQDPILREALEISTPTLSKTIDEALRAGQITTSKARRAVRAIERYRLRMASRATPFGILAGVATATFGSTPHVKLGDEHTKSARVDIEWLLKVIAQLELHVEVLRTLRVVANDLSFPRGSRLVLPYRVNAADDQRLSREISVRRTSVTEFVMAEALLPVNYADLEKSLFVKYPEVPEEVRTEFLTKLIESGFLLSELNPPSDSSDPLDYVLGILEQHVDQFAPEVRAIVAELASIRRGLAEYESVRLGKGRERLMQITERMSRLQSTERALQVDLTLDVEAQIPEIVRTEIEEAAQLLCTPFGRANSALNEYHIDFLERYGEGRVVPLRELLNPAIGLGAPAGYSAPQSPRRLRGSLKFDSEYNQKLLLLAQEAAFDRAREIVLDDAIAEYLVSRGEPPMSFDVLAHLMGDSMDAVAQGDFRLVVCGGRSGAGSIAGRFAHLLGDAGNRIGALVRDLPTFNSETIRAQMTFPTRLARAANVTQVPIWTDHVISLGSFAERHRNDVLGMADLGVVANSRRLAVVSVHSGREIVATATHAVAVDKFAPNAARLLLEIGQKSDTHVGWNWGVAGRLSYLPRVRRGRVIFSSAQWTPNEPELRSLNTSPANWRRAFGQWRKRWQVPDRVQVVVDDNRITVDLQSSSHLDLLRNELTREPSSYLMETPTDGEFSNGWLSSGRGIAGHANELGFSLVRNAAPQAATPRVLGRPTATERKVQAPGSEWLYAKVYCPEEQQDEIITERLPALLKQLTGIKNRWFFVRYRDDRAHLRLRFHGEQGWLAGEFLPELGAWAAELTRDGLGGQFTLDTYEPEYERYGGEAAIASAETAFHADSQACLEQKSLLDRRILQIPPTVLVAANYADLACRLLGEEYGVMWLLEAPVPDARPHLGPEQRRQARALIGSALVQGDAPTRTAAAALHDVWHRRATAVTQYGHKLRALGHISTVTPEEALPSVLHMHHNRLVGIDPIAERQALWLAKDAARTWHHTKGRAQ